MSSLFAQLQKVAPAHGLSRLAGRFASSENRLVSQPFIRWFARTYNVNLDEAEFGAPEDYRCFNDFFTRRLKPGSRPIENGIVSPADGAISQLGSIEKGQLLQAKGHRYGLRTLAGELADGLEGGSFVTVYLSPRDYHRVHLPWDGRLTATLAVPGELFSVNAVTEQHIEGLFARNERLVCRFETDFGPMLVVLVGAMIVASIATDWSGPLSPYRREERTDYDLHYDRGEEIGRFLLGSTVICCFPPGAVRLNDGLSPGTAIRMGESIGQPLSG